RAAPHEHCAVFVVGQALAADQLVGKVGKRTIVERELALQGAIGDALPPSQQLDRRIDDTLETHPTQYMGPPVASTRTSPRGGAALLGAARRCSGPAAAMRSAEEVSRASRRVATPRSCRPCRACRRAVTRA